MMGEQHSQKFWKLMGFLALIAFSQYALSQSSSTSEQVPASDVVEAQEADEDDTSAQQADGETAQTEDEEEEGSGRFIPTEQLSQDLGASFPVDI